MNINELGQQIMDTDSMTELELIGKRIKGLVDSKQVTGDDVVIMRKVWVKRRDELKHSWCGIHNDPSKWNIEGDVVTCKECGRWIGRKVAGVKEKGR